MMGKPHTHKVFCNIISLNGEIYNYKYLSALVKSKGINIESNSETEFITEHYWGYAKVTDSKTNEYEVTHPKWKQYLVTHSEINVDFGAVYGTDFEFINRLKPNSVMLIEGSEITVENKTKIGTQNKA